MPLHKEIDFEDENRAHRGAHAWLFAACVGVVGSVSTYADRTAVTLVIECDGQAEVAACDPSRPCFHAADCLGDVF